MNEKALAEMIRELFSQETGVVFKIKFSNNKIMVFTGVLYTEAINEDLVNRLEKLITSEHSLVGWYLDPDAPRDYFTQTTLFMLVKPWTAIGKV